MFKGLLNVGIPPWQSKQVREPNVSFPGMLSPEWTSRHFVF